MTEISHETRIPSTVGIAAGTSESPDLILCTLLELLLGRASIISPAELSLSVGETRKSEPSAAAEEINPVQLDSSRLIRIPTREELAADPAAAWLVIVRESPMIDINHADAELLANLPGIDPATACAIIDYRRKTVLFGVSRI